VNAQPIEHLGRETSNRQLVLIKRDDEKSSIRGRKDEVSRSRIPCEHALNQLVTLSCPQVHHDNPVLLGISIVRPHPKQQALSMGEHLRPGESRLMMRGVRRRHFVPSATVGLDPLDSSWGVEVDVSVRAPGYASTVKSAVG